MVGGGLYFVLSNRAPAPPVGVSARPSDTTAAVVAAPTQAPASLESPEMVSAPAVTGHSGSASLDAPAAPAPSGRDRLAEEVALLSRATKALRAGRAGEALRALDEHQSRFPRGALSEERRAAKAEALCSLGRVSEGRAELGRLAPQSPAAARAKQVCDSK
jgi:hypothetical protein